MIEALERPRLQGELPDHLEPGGGGRGARVGGIGVAESDRWTDRARRVPPQNGEWLTQR
jgi:hypothetical protein